MNLNLPVRIQGHDSSGDSWEEMSRLNLAFLGQRAERLVSTE